MRRRVFNVLCVLVLLLLAGVVALWEQTHAWSRPRDREWFASPGNRWRVVSHRGWFRVENWRRPDGSVRLALSERHEQLAEERRVLRDRQREWFRQHLVMPVLGDAPTAPGDADVAGAAATVRREGAALERIKEVRAGLAAWNNAAKTPRLRTIRIPYALPAGVLVAMAAALSAGFVRQTLAARRRERLAMQTAGSSVPIASGNPADHRARPGVVPPVIRSGTGSTELPSSAPAMPSDRGLETPLPSLPRLARRLPPRRYLGRGR